MLRRVLVATDGSAHAQRAEAFAGRLVAPGQLLELELLYVEPRLPPRRVAPHPRVPWHSAPPRLPVEVVERAEAVLTAAETRVRAVPDAADAPIWRRYLASNDVAGWIVHEAERANADLIVLGGRDHGGLMGLLGEGVCTEVLRRARRPVLLVP